MPARKAINNNQRHGYVGVRSISAASKERGLVIKKVFDARTSPKALTKELGLIYMW